MTLWWVMGASAVGKKTLMRAAVEEASVRAALGLSDGIWAAWVNDGPLEPVDAAAIALGHDGDVLLRWQFGREAAMTRDDWRGHRQGVILVEADPVVHYARMQAREGDRWTPEMLAGEAAAVRALAGLMAHACEGLFRVVDASQGYRVVEAGV